jgi:hypothetical protein
MKETQASYFTRLNAAEKRIADAIIQQQDVFIAFQIHHLQKTQVAIQREHDRTRNMIVDASEKIIQSTSRKSTRFLESLC